MLCSCLILRLPLLMLFFYPIFSFPYLRYFILISLFFLFHVNLSSLPVFSSLLFILFPVKRSSFPCALPIRPSFYISPSLYFLLSSLLFLHFFLRSKFPFPYVSFFPPFCSSHSSYSSYFLCYINPSSFPFVPCFVHSSNISPLL